MSANRVINFSPGPAKLPEEVMKKAQGEFVNFAGTGVSVMELSHRGAEFSKILNEAEQNLRELMQIPDNYDVIFLQGGASGQFSGIPLNLIGLKPGKTADYMVTGAWSAKAAKEAEKYGSVNLVFPKTKKYTTIPDKSEWTINPDASYLYYCSNETIHGVEFPYVPESYNDVPIVCDMSSSVLSHHIDVSKFGVIFAGAQKNIGPAGAVLLIIRKDLIGKALPGCPTVLDFKIQAGNNSCYNTPPTYSIYMIGLVFDWILKNGGLDVVQDRNLRKATCVYEAVDNSRGFYTSPVHPSCRSKMNVAVRIGGPDGDEALEKAFLDEAGKKGMIGLKGHRSVGGIRISLYNAISLEESLSLVEFMRDFQTRHQ